MSCEGGAAAILVLDESGVGAEWDSAITVGAAAEKCDSCEREAQAELVLRVGEGVLCEKSPIS